MRAHTTNVGIARQIWLTKRFADHFVNKLSDKNLATNLTPRLLYDNKTVNPKNTREDMVASPQDAQTTRKTMSSAVVGTGKESVGKRAGSFGGRMKSFLRSSSSSKRDSNKKSRAQTILPKVTVHAEPPKLVHVESEEPPKVDINNGSAEVAGVVPSISEEELLSDEVQSSSNCPSDAARYPQIIESRQKQDQEQQLLAEENVLDVSYPSDNASLVRSLKAVAVVPVDTTPQKRRSVIIGSIDTDSTTDSASSSQSEPPHSPESVASPARSSVSQRESTTAKEDATVGEGTEGSSTYYQNLLLRSQDSELEDESLSFGTFGTLKSRDTTLDGLSFVNAIGNLMERQLKVLEKNLPCQEEDKLNEIKEEAEAKEVKQIESMNGTKYVAADKEDDEDNDHDDNEHLKTSGRSMDSRIITGFTTPSTGTRIISNTPRGRQQKQQQNHQNSNEVDEMDDSLASSVSDDIDEDEDRIIPIEQKECDLARSISEINIRMKNASQSPPSSSAGEPSILNILNDLAREEGSEYQSIVSPSVSGTVSVLGDDIVSQQGGAWNVFECVHCQSEKLCAGQESSAKALEGDTSLLSYEGADLYDIAEENSLSPSTASPGEIPVLLPIPESLPQHSVRAVDEEIPVEQAMEQTVESHELVVSTITHSRADVSRLIRGASDKEAFLENFRARFPDLYKSMVKELFLTAEKSSAKSKPKESNKSGSDKTSLSLNRAMPAKTAKNKDATSVKASKKVDATLSGKSGQQAEPMSKRRSFFGVFGNKNEKKEVDNSSKTTKHETKATGKENPELKKPKRNVVEKDESSKVAKMVQQGTDRQPRLSTQKEANMKSQHETQLSRAKSGKAGVKSQSNPGRGKELIKPVSPPRVVKKTEMPQFELSPESPENKPTTKHHTAVSATASASASKPPKGKPATKENKTVSAPRTVQTILEKFHATPAPSLRKSHSTSFQRPQPGTIKRSQSASAVKAASAATKRAMKASNKNTSANVANKSSMEQTDATRLTKASSLLQLSRTRKTEAPEAPKVDERPLRDSPSKTSTSSTDAKSASRSRRKVAFSRTPLILQRLQSSRSAMASKSPEDSLEEGVSFLLEDEQGVSLKTSSWFDDEISVSGYMTPPSQTPDVLVTSHAIPQNPTPPSPVQLYGAGDKEFEEFDGYGEY